MLTFALSLFALLHLTHRDAARAHEAASHQQGTVASARVPAEKGGGRLAFQNGGRAQLHGFREERNRKSFQKKGHGDR